MPRDPNAKLDITRQKEAYNDSVADIFAKLQKDQQVFYVGSVDGNAAYSGRRIAGQLATVDQGVNKLTTNRGDILLVSPFHSEDIATAGAIACDVADVQIIGLNFGDQRPSITASDTAATWTVTAANVVIKGFTLTCNIASQTTFLDLNLDADGCVLDGLRLLEGSATGLNFITLTTANNVVMRNIFCRATTAGNYNEVVLIAGTPNNLILEDWNVRGDFDEACIQNAVGNIATNMTLRRMVLRNTLTGQHAIQLVSACTGFAEDILCVTDALATSFDAGALEIGANVKYQSTTGGDVGVTDVFVVPDSVSNILGADDADNGFASTNVVANVDGSVLERLEAIQQHVGATDGSTNILGADDADNGFSSTNVADNRDGSIVERLESVIATLRDDVASNFVGVDDADNAAATTNVVANDDGSILERLEGVKQGIILARGTFTTSSATVPADTGRTEANDYWNGSLLVPMAGAIVGEPRLIVDFVNAGGVFTLDADIPFTAVPGTVAYIIIPGNIQIAPTADSTANATPAHVIGRKTDAAIADTIEGAAATTQSLVADIKAVLQRIGTDSVNNTAATTLVADNRDGSVLERLETIIATLRDDVASNFIGIDDADNTAATTNVVANEDGSILERLERIQQDTGRGTGTALATNESLADVLYATNGIATFPAAALPANGVSIAEVLREAYDQLDKSVSNTTAVITSGGTIFTIAGGPIEILSLVARCVIANGAGVQTLQWSADGTDGAATTFSGASADLASVAAGVMVILQGNTLATVPSVATNGVATGQTVSNGVIVPAGIITTTYAGGPSTGTWQHHLRYRPLARGVTVT